MVEQQVHDVALRCHLADGAERFTQRTNDPANDIQGKEHTFETHRLVPIRRCIAPRAAESLENGALVVGPFGVRWIGSERCVAQLAREQKCPENPLREIVAFRVSPSSENQGGFENVARAVAFTSVVVASPVRKTCVSRRPGILRCPTDLIGELSEAVVVEGLHSIHQRSVLRRSGELRQR
jgi:hypothetical protein